MAKDLTWGQLPRSGVVIIFGHRGGGKTALAWWLAQRASDAGRPVVAYALTDPARKIVPQWVQHASTPAEVAKLPSCVLVVDEAALQVHARRHQSEGNIQWNQIVTVSRHKDHLVLLVAQHTRQLDVGLVAEADLVIFKSPSSLHVRFARQELRPEVEQAFKRFAELKVGRRVQWAYLVDYHGERTGFVKNGLPRFWSDELSKAFASVDLLPVGSHAIFGNGRGR